VVRQLSGWADRVRIPPFNLEGLDAVVDVGAIAPESLATLVQARSTVAFADSARGLWDGQLRSLDPGPVVDSARALVRQLNSANPLRLGLAGTAQLANSARATLASLSGTRQRLAGLDSTVRWGMATLAAAVQRLAQARQADYAYARGLLRLPGLDTPDLSSSIFGDMALQRMEPVLYWVNQAARFLPPGLDPRRYPGPKRPRRAGVTVRFPDPNELPDFLVELAELDMVIGGAGAAAGAYAARMTGLTTEPAIYGRPLVASVERTGAARGPTDVALDLVLDRTGARIRDSADVTLRGIPLPPARLTAVGALLEFGRGTSTLDFTRTGDSISGRWVFRSSNVTWSRLERPDTAAQAGAVERRARDFVWQTVSSLREVTIDLRFFGSPRGPSLRISSNVGRAVAQNLREQLGQQIRRAEDEVRARVDQLVSARIEEAQSRVASLETEVSQRVGVRLEDVTAVRGELERALRRIVPGG
jgi:uncharacterized protein (TIGR03545 family)